jgi:NodT family efflux transporter outer membrane factor (OMF) lipoprotein
MSFYYSNIKTLAVAMLTCCVAGCMVGTDYQQPDTKPPENWRAASSSQEQAIEQQWWHNFHDPLLDQLITTVINSNLDIKLAENRITEARATRETAKASLLPTGDMMANANRQQNQLGFPSGGPTNLSSMVKQPFNIFKAGFDASWELDLFGGHRRDVEASEAELTAANISREDMLISILAETARTYLDVRLNQSQLAIASDIVETDRKALLISKQRYELGDSDSIQASRDNARLEHDQAQLANYRNLQAQAEYALDVLMAATPGTAHDMLAASASLPVADRQLILAAPAKVIANRPDIRYAERKLASATSQQGVALARFFPDISLTGFVGLFNTNINNFVNMGSKAFGMGASVFWPILSYGSLSANLDAADARQQTALTQYQKTIISALADVERAFTAYSEQDNYLHTLEKETVEYNNLLDIAKQRFDHGLTAYPDVLDAERNLAANKNQLAVAKALTSQNLIAVYKSLGGGWRQTIDIAK